MLLQKGTSCIWWVWCLFCPTRQFNLNSLPWTCNLTVFYCLDLEYWQGILTINFSRKSNILCMHTQTHKKQATIGTIMPKKEGFLWAIWSFDGRSPCDFSTKLALRCMLCRVSLCAYNPRNMEILAASSDVCLHAWCAHVRNYSNCGQGIHSGKKPT